MNFKKSLLIITATLSIVSCSNEEPSNITSELTQTEVKEIVQENLITGNLSSVLEKVSEIKPVSNELGARLSSCFSRSLTRIDDRTQVLRINFKEGCRNFITGQELSGELSIKTSLLENGYQKNVNFFDFKINGTTLNGFVSIKKDFNTTNGSTPFSIFGGVFTATLESGKIISVNGSWTSRFIKGANTPLNLLDDERAIVGEWTINSDGVEKRIETTRALIKKSFLRCKFISRGTILLVKQGERFTINFGDDSDSCTDKVSVTNPDGTTKVLSLKDLL